MMKRDKLKIDKENFITSLKKTGNTVSSSIPISINENLKLLKNKGIINNFHSKSWEIFSKDSKITMDIVITVCGNARDEECPYWSGNPMRAHWGVSDPANVTGSNSEKQIAFETTYYTLEKKAKAFLDLEFENMSRDILQKNINNISRII